MKRAKKYKKLKVGLIAFFAIIILSVSGIFYVYSKYMGGIETTQITQNKDELKIDPGVDTNSSSEIINIALFGVDGIYDDYDEKRADSIMIATIDLQHKKFKLTSIMRDSYVDIPGHTLDKITHAYYFEGPSLAIKTINENYDMNITDYVTVNFDALREVVDALGGIEINVKAEDIASINRANAAQKAYRNEITTPGPQTLDGYQALSYSRIRDVYQGDFDRTKRQREVVEGILSKAINNNDLPQLLGLIETVAPFVQTSLDSTQMISLATTISTSGITKTEEFRLPVDGQYLNLHVDSVYYMRPDTLSENVTSLHKFIYDEKDYVPSLTVQGISDGIANVKDETVIPQ